MTLTAVLLAGGLSRRMGQDKATLTRAGEPAWARQFKLLRALQPDHLWLSARTRPAWCPPEIEVVPDEPPSRGPLSGLTATLQRLETSHLFALAIDLPQMTPQMLSRLWQLAQPGCGVIPVNEDSLEPLCAIYPREAVSVAKEALAGDDLSLRRFAGTLLQQNLLRTYLLTEKEKSLFRNVNAPADMC
jgi:molybdopterin-guanine dinucleotide biosynthesis protein A